jgi:hypothetical protein
LGLENKDHGSKSLEQHLGRRGQRGTHEREKGLKETHREFSTILSVKGMVFGSFIIIGQELLPLPEDHGRNRALSKTSVAFWLHVLTFTWI